MSEQSGPITREQVERAIDGMREKPGMWHVIEDALGRGWKAPEYVVSMWVHGSWDGTLAALTRWRDELAAAEPVRRVARWDADLEAYTLTPTHDDGALMTHAVEDAAKARAWGYTIEGGPEPAEDSPERLRERREALGWTTAYAGHWVPWFDHTDVERAESGKGIPAFVARYAAALSAEEARRAEEERLACAYRESDGTLVWDDSPLPEPERPAPRFKVRDPYGDGADVDDEPASPPAPEVVDVPQPETWHARLVRLSRDVVLATKVHDDAQSARHLAETRADDAWKALRAADHALKDATECAAILTAAQQGGAS